GLFGGLQVVGSFTPRPDERPIGIFLLHVRPPLTERIAISCVAFGALGFVLSVATIAMTSSSEPSLVDEDLADPGPAVRGVRVVELRRHRPGSTAVRRLREQAVALGA